MREVLLPVRRLNAPHRRTLDAGGLAVAMMLAGYTSVRLGKDANWDLQNSLLDNGYALMEMRLSCDLAPAQIQSFHDPRPSTSIAASCSPRRATSPTSHRSRVCGLTRTLSGAR